ncbi:succinate dehydrogenase, cytochrome b556 subunit [Porticoccus sp. W117]|uniref:succinate dehydrogenase, cytochrome b556 subunit n=1 Tax=Porticoccus sp. W117 TaxID=3054777 RepID=UPI002599EDDD|nr:succinate dehydrogenase, cytochrome b556 subunit [Porticoccus sp. W117]MDM3872659.1 succinate dehydrogenase, cytochrome b556 subunit [Porticoccus sp. W117]
MNNSRPVNLDLGTVSFPITAIASILHRVCAVISWVGMGFLLMALALALGSKESFEALVTLLKENLLAQIVSWGLLTAFGYYCMGTVKHIIQDFGLFEDFQGGKAISWVAIVGGVIISIAAGVMIWA